MHNSLFFIDNDDLHRVDMYEQFRFFEYMLPVHYQSSATAKMLLYDVAIYLYEPDTPVLNKKNMMQHTVTTFFLEQFLASKRAAKLKVFTQLKFHHALFLSVFYCNYCLHIYDEALQQLQKSEQTMLRESDRINMSILFEKKYEQYESYPKTLVIAQTKLFKHVQQLWQQQDVEQTIMQELSKLADRYRFSQKDMQQALNGHFLTNHS